MANPRIGVLLFNLGGPEKPEDVKPFLYNLFSDPDIIRIRNNAFRKAVAWLITALRHKRSSGYYALIGGGSPLRKITDQQAAALERQLADEGFPVKVYVGMRCWNPTIDEALTAVERDEITHLVVLPLFPQFSVTTTGSCINYFNARLRQSPRASAIQASYVTRWFDEPLYIEALAGLIRAEFRNFPDPDPRAIYIVYSAHSIPKRYIDEGDPYLEHIQHTVALLNEKLGNKSQWTLSFQSKVGPVKWLEPSTEQIIRTLGRRGTRQALLVPISFVSDHIETLYEIDIQYRKEAESVGVSHFRRCAALNVNPTFIAALAALVKEQLASLQISSAAAVQHEQPNLFR
ncbi:MAG: ferrochelatase [Acidobacteriia bacterium]|nr:ferrochelatase [Terriglobia bacterium]